MPISEAKRIREHAGPDRHGNRVACHLTVIEDTHAAGKRTAPNLSAVINGQAVFHGSIAFAVRTIL